LKDKDKQLESLLELSSSWTFV